MSYEEKVISAALGQIRTVTIKKGPPTARLNASLTVKRLSQQQPEYEALSYCWGDINPPCFIILDGTEFIVTPNLHAALIALRSEYVDRTLWIDALCINQRDYTERSTQVPLMRSIYRYATNTIIWLGPSSPTSGFTFKFLQNINIKRRWNDISERPALLARKEVFKRAVEARPDLQHIVRCGFYGDIAKRAYWKRIWIVQEVVLSRTAIVMCGPDSITWDKFTDAVWQIDTVTSMVLPTFWQSVDGVPSLEIIENLQRMILGRASIPIEDAVAVIRGSRSTDPVDKIYGVFGMVEDNRFSADYTQTTASVYTRLVDHCLNLSKSLDIICTRSRSQSASDLPSWVPDWRALRQNFDTRSPDETVGKMPDLECGTDLPAQPLVIKWISGFLLRRTTAPDTFNSYGATPAPRVWNAHLQRLPIASINYSTATLTARGVRIGVIPHKGTGDVLYRGVQDPQTHFYNTFSSWEDLALRTFGNCKSTTHSGITLLDVLDQCLRILDTYLMRQGVDRRTGGRKIERRPGERESRKEKYASTNRLYIGGGCVIEAFVKTLFCDRDQDWLAFSRASYDGFWTGEEAWAIELQACFMSMHRRFFVTDGGYIGLGPVAARDGDVVCVLFGCSIPVVLREDEGGWTFVGESYVHGIMEGEAVVARDSARFREDEWTLR